MNKRRVASLLRELADAIEQDEPAPKPRRKLVKPQAGAKPSAEMVDRVRRNLRRQGVVA